jgi:hypothetical protein
MASVNDPRHAELIGRVDEYLQSAGFCTSEKTYHDGHMDKGAAEKLRLTFSPTALHIRASADRIAVHPLDGMTLYYDAKTGGGKDILAEALPLADHMRHAERGVLCLYCCVNRGADKGFWAHAVPPVRTLFIPHQREAALTEWYDRHLPAMFPAVSDVVHLGDVRGSRDPFVAIDEFVVATMPTWQELLVQERARWLSKDGPDLKAVG